MSEVGIFSKAAIAAALEAAEQFMLEETYSFPAAKRRRILGAIQRQAILEIDWLLVCDALGSRDDEFHGRHPAGAALYAAAFWFHRARVEYVPGGELSDAG